jgi:hypothetical protein
MSGGAYFLKIFIPQNSHGLSALCNLLKIYYAQPLAITQLLIGNPIDFLNGIYQRIAY